MIMDKQADRAPVKRSLETLLIGDIAEANGLKKMRSADTKPYRLREIHKCAGI
jgi:hypothetical protein